MKLFQKSRKQAFTILEIMIALFIFALVLTSFAGAQTTSGSKRFLEHYPPA